MVEDDVVGVDEPDEETEPEPTKEGKRGCYEVSIKSNGSVVCSNCMRHWHWHCLFVCDRPSHALCFGRPRESYALAMSGAAWKSSWSTECHSVVGAHQARKSS